MKTLDLKYIKSRRVELGITQQMMANKLGFKSVSTYSKYENGAHAFWADQLPVLSYELNCNIADFFNKNIAKTAI